MTGFPLQKLAKICKSATPKSLALLAIGYESEMISTDRNFNNEISTVFSSVPVISNREFYFHWNLYKKLNILMQNVNIQLAEIMIFRERLYMCHLLVRIEPIMNDDERSDLLQEPINLYVSAINERIQKMTNIKYIAETIEREYFENNIFITSHPIWKSITDTLTELEQSHNSEFVKKRLPFTGVVYKNIESVCKPDGDSAQEEISKIINAAMPE